MADLTTLPSGSPITASWGWPAMGVEVAAGHQHRGVAPPLGVGELGPIARLKDPGFGHSRSTLRSVFAACRRLPVVFPGMSRPALSPSRAADFKQCPLLYRFRAIDRLPEPPSAAQLRGSVVHGALERLFALPAAQRGPETAQGLVAPAWEQLLDTAPDCAAGLDAEQLMAEARKLLARYYRLEDPRRFDPQSCEQRVEVELADGTLLRGFVDRIDVAAHRRTAGGRLQDR